MYIPKNRIKPNQYTSGLEYQILATGELYAGHYHSLWNGKIYTGKTQNDSDIREIIPIIASSGEGQENLPTETTVNVIALGLEDAEVKYPYSTGDPLIENNLTQEWNQRDVSTYLELRGESIIDDKPRNMPQQSYPKPTIENYELGSYTRYFALKINEIKYIELDFDTYTKMFKQNAQIVWELYDVYSIQWTLIGDEDEVAKTNRNQVLIAEQRNQTRGFQSFLRRDYLKFYKNPPEDFSSTSQTQTAPPGYHYMPDGSLMLDSQMSSTGGETSDDGETPGDGRTFDGGGTNSGNGGSGGGGGGGRGGY